MNLKTLKNKLGTTKYGDNSKYVKYNVDNFNVKDSTIQECVETNFHCLYTEYNIQG